MQSVINYYYLAKQIWMLGASQKMMLLKSSLLLIIFRVLLKVLPFDRLYGHLNKLLRATPNTYTNNMHYTYLVIWAAEKCGRYLLRTRCLAQSLTVLVLLNQKGIACQLRLGIIPGIDEDTAHAWIVAEDKILTGDNHKVHLYLPINHANQT